jgi:hypothetical protein
LKAKSIANESSFFGFRASMIKWALLFKDSKRGRFTQVMLLPHGVANR